MENMNPNNHGMVESSGKNLPRDTFLYLAALVSLITSCVSFGILVFQIINRYYPDLVFTNGFVVNSSSYYQMMIGPLSFLIIVFPIFLLIARFLRKDILRHAEKQEMRIRKWLIYLTLFIAAIVVVGDFIAVFRGLLGGELTVRFILKALAILFIAGSSFYYYILELRDPSSKNIKWLSWLVIVVVAAAIAFGIYIIGLPTNQRKIKMDDMRVSNLSVIQSRIVEYWMNNEKLPIDLNDINDPLNGWVVPSDPSTGASYRYEVVTNQKPNYKFKLCAAFEAATGDEGVTPAGTAKIDSSPYDENWQHSIGEKCFDRTIDPKLYLPVKK